MCSDITHLTPSESLVIEAQGLGKCYGIYDKPTDRLKQLLWGRWRKFSREFWSLRGVDLAIRKGEVVGIVGRNGAGKSTLLQMICGTMPPSEGVLKVHGRVAALLELGAGFNPEFTGIENVFTNGALLGLTHQQIQEKLPDILSFADIGEFVHQPVKTYSSGMFVRLAFAVATSVDPDILIIDEALSVGDGAFARKSFERIMKLKESGATILFCSHSMYQVEALCSRAIWLDSGVVRLAGSAAEVTQAYNASLGLPDGADQGERSLQLPVVASGTGRILSVTALCDGQHGRFVNVKSGLSDLTFQVEFAIDPSLPIPGLAFGFADGMGQTVASAVSVHDGAQLFVDATGRGSASATFRKIPLLKGEYSVTVFLVTEDALNAYDQREDCLRFKVAQDSLEQGLVSLKHDWHCEND